MPPFAQICRIGTTAITSTNNRNFSLLTTPFLVLIAVLNPLLYGQNNSRKNHAATYQFINLEIEKAIISLL